MDSEEKLRLKAKQMEEDSEPDREPIYKPV